MLIGADAALVFEPFRFSHFEHAYDFYKPDLGSFVFVRLSLRVPHSRRASLYRLLFEGVGLMLWGPEK